MSLRRPRLHNLLSLQPKALICRAFHRGPSNSRAPYRRNPPPFQKKPPNRSQVCLPRYTARCIYWSSEGRHGFFRELIDGWQCIAYESDLLDGSHSGKLPRRGDIVEFSLMNDLQSQQGRPPPADPKKYKSFRMINITCPGSVPLSTK